MADISKVYIVIKINLQKPGSVGGLGLPVYKHYYRAANVKALMYWEKGTLNNRSLEAPLWVQMVTGMVVGTSLAAMLFSMFDKPTAINKLNIVLKNSIKILNQVKKFCPCQIPLCVHQFSTIILFHPHGLTEPILFGRRMVNVLLKTFMLREGLHL